MCSSLKGVSIRIATDASDFAWGERTMFGPMELAREYFLEWEAVRSSAYRELLGIFWCLEALVHMCDGIFVVLQVDAQNLLEIVNRGSPKLNINERARELFWFCQRHRITTFVK
jgi:hypothetical protein